jgi:hypothetical protein
VHYRVLWEVSARVCNGRYGCVRECSRTLCLGRQSTVLQPICEILHGVECWRIFDWTPPRI